METTGYGADRPAAPRRLRVTAIDERLFEAYNIPAFSLGGDGENPFAEVAELPSNVENGYSLVSGIAIFEAALSE